MEYKNFEQDFVLRTKENLEWCLSCNDIPHSTTNLVNNCLGLIVLPKAFSSDEQLSKMSPFVDSLDLSKNIIKIKNDDRSFASVLRHCRNGISHGHIQQEVENGHIVGLYITDCYENNDRIHTKLHFTIDELQHFALTIADSYLQVKTNK